MNSQKRYLSSIAVLFNQSLRSGIVPTSYKGANVCPIPKRSKHAIVYDYQPIRLLNSGLIF